MSKHILVLEDEPSIREIIGACLKDLCGWSPRLAEHGKQALELAKDNPPDVILLDISMPDMDGYQFFELLQSNPETQQIPVIVLTAKVLPSDRDRFQQMGIKGLIAKPFNPAALCQEINHIMQW